MSQQCAREPFNAIAAEIMPMSAIEAMNLWQLWKFMRMYNLTVLLKPPILFVVGPHYKTLKTINNSCPKVPPLENCEDHGDVKGFQNYGRKTSGHTIPGTQQGT